MKKCLLFVLMLMVIAGQLMAQATIAKLKYEEAEEAFVSNDFVTTLSKLDEAEKILGGPNPKTLYLRISSQFKLFKGEPAVDLEAMLDLRKNCNTYLAKYETVDGIEDKYKEVYKMSEYIKSFAIPEPAFANVQKGTATVTDIEEVADAYYLIENFKRAADYFKRAADKGSASAATKLAYLYHRGFGVKQDVDKGNALLEIGLKAGNADAYHTRAFSYRYGDEGMPKDSVKSLEYFRKSFEAALPLAEKGNAEYMFYAGRALVDTKTADTTTGIEWITRSANKGYVEGLAYLGGYYRSGTYVEQDNAKAMQLFLKAVSKGSCYSMQRIAYMYYSGAGVTQDYTKAREWYEKASDYGEDYSTYQLGLIYENGRGVDKDYAKAIAYYELAGKKGYGQGYNSAGNMYYWGTGVTTDYSKCVKYYQKAAEADVLAAYNNLANTYYKGGNGITKDYAKAAEWYLKGAAKGHAWCMYNYGNMCYNGDGMPVDYAKAAEWYTKAAEKNNTDAMDKLYNMYYNGLGVKKDKKVAQEWADKSAVIKAKQS